MTTIADAAAATPDLLNAILASIGLGNCYRSTTKRHFEQGASLVTQSTFALDLSG